MKKKLSLVVLIAMLALVCFGLLAACSDNIEDYTLEVLMSKVETQIANAQGKTSCTLSKTVNVIDADDKEITCAVKWTTVGEGVTLTEKTDSVTVTVAENVTSYILKGVLVDGKNQPYKLNGEACEVMRSVSVVGGSNQGNQGNQGNNQGTTTKTLLEQVKEAAVSSPAADTNYVLAMYQGTLDKVLYATATMDSGKFLATTETINQAATVTVEATTGGFYIALTANGGAKQYITLVDDTGTSANTKTKISLTAAPSTVYSVGQDNMLLGVFSGKNFMLSTHGSYATISSNSDFYINDSKGAYAIDISQFIARLIPANTVITTPSTGTGGTVSGGDNGNTGNTGNTGDNGNTGNTGNQGGTTTITPDGTSVTFDMTGKTSSFVNFTTIKDGDITISATNGTGGNTETRYSDSELRVYYGATLTISVASGKTIKSITFTTETHDKEIDFTTTVGTYTSGSWTGSAASVTFTAEGTKGHVRITSITVVYA